MTKRQRVVRMKPVQMWVIVYKDTGEVYGTRMYDAEPSLPSHRIVGPITLREPARRKRRSKR